MTSLLITSFPDHVAGEQRGKMLQPRAPLAIYIKPIAHRAKLVWRSVECRSARPLVTCRSPVERSLLTTYMKVGGTFCIGIPNSIRGDAVCCRTLLVCHTRVESQIASREPVLITPVSKGYAGASSAPSANPTARWCCSSARNSSIVSRNSDSSSPSCSA